MKTNRTISQVSATTLAAACISLLALFPAIIHAAPDAARVAGDLKVDGIHFSSDGSVQTKANPWGNGDPDAAGNIGFMQGNVGIGTLKPSATLDVNGTFNTTGNVSFGTEAGVSPVVTLKAISGANALYSGLFINLNSDGATYALSGSANGASNRVDSPHFGVHGEASGGSVNYGLMGRAYDTDALGNYGVYGYAAGGADNYAGYFQGNMMATGNAAIGSGGMGVSPVITLRAMGGPNDIYTGMFSNSLNTDGAVYALSGRADGVTNRESSPHFGVHGEAFGGSVNYGIMGEVYDADALANYGVYGSAAGGATNYAGYFQGNMLVTGDINYGSLTHASDRRLKENIKPLENALAKVAAINGVYYNMKDKPGQTEVGVIAQDVQAVLPEAVSVIDKENGYLGVSYTSLVPVLIEAVKELKAENDALKADLAEIRKLLGR